MTKRIIAIVFLALLSAGRDGLAQTDDATALVRRVLDKQKTRPFWFRLRSITFGYVPYVFDVRTTAEKYDGKGSIKGDRPQGWASGVFTPVEGVLLYTPTDFGGKGVPEREQKEWEEDREKTLAKAKGRSESEKAKIRAKEEKELTERATFWGEFTKAFRFQILERKEHNGRQTVVIGYSPLPNYKPGNAIDTKYLPKIKGQIWIDETDKEIARFEMEFTDNISIGFGLVGKVSQGTSYAMDLRKLIDDRWLPVRAETTIRLRQLLVTKTNEKYIVEYGNYRKFSTDSRILSTEPVVDRQK
jgi:hypothetical protein